MEPLAFGWSQLLLVPVPGQQRLIIDRHYPTMGYSQRHRWIRAKCKKCIRAPRSAVGLASERSGEPWACGGWWMVG